MKTWQRSYCRWLRLFAWATAWALLYLSICMPDKQWMFHIVQR